MTWKIEIFAHSVPEAIAELAARYESAEAENTYPPSYTEFAKTMLKAIPYDPTQGVQVQVTGSPTVTDPAGADVHFVVGRIPFGHPNWPHDRE
jgi:hypothetical protein